MINFWKAQYVVQGDIKYCYFNTSHEAAELLLIGERAGTLSSHSITSPDGDVYNSPIRGGDSKVWSALALGLEVLKPYQDTLDLVAKLDDAGIEFDQAVEWINRIIKSGEIIPPFEKEN